VLWTVRVAWLGLPLFAGPALVGALDGRSTAVVAVAGILAAAGWAVGIVAVLVPRSVGLTVLRIGAPAALAAAVVCALTADGVGAAEVAALAGCALLTGLVLLVPAVADAFVDGSSYGPERRFSLRIPVALLIGPSQLAWVAVVVPMAVGPLLVAAGQWVAGVVVVAVGVLLARPAARSLHQLSRRWVVFVPAGLVLHDPLTLVEPVLFAKRMVRSLGPASIDAAASATDVTGGAPGLVLELVLTEETAVGLVAGREKASTVETARLLFTPARPGAVLTEATTRSFPSSVSRQ
jgi:hypothetical protein